MRIYRSFVWLNSTTLGGGLLLIACTQFLGLSTKALFLHPEVYPDLSIGFLTRLFQILCAVPPSICGFSFGLLRMIRPRSPENWFILASSCLTAGFLVNEIYRIHVALAGVGISKPITILVYATCLFAYGWGFRHKIQRTPYPILLMGLGILFLGIAIDSLQLSDQGISNFLEGIPKLLSAVNISLYFWEVCSQEVMKSSV
jgi:hypothetical protein